MYKVNLQKHLFWTFGWFATGLIIFVAFVFSVIFYYTFDNEIDKSLQQAVQEITQRHIRFDQGVLKYQRYQNTLSLSNTLRELDVSAVIFDKNLNRIGTFGVYRTFQAQGIIDQFINRQEIETAKSESKSRLTHPVVHKTNHIYEVYTVPLRYQGEVMAVLQIARQATFINHLYTIIGYVILLVIPLSLLISWIVSYLVSRRLAKPLENFIILLKKVHNNIIPHQLQIKGKTYQEIKDLEKTINWLLSRLHEYLDQQKQFVAQASHELKTPITRIVTEIDVLLHEQQIDINKIKNIKNQLLDMGDTIESLLVLARIDSLNSLQLPQTEPIKIKNIITKSLQQFEFKRQQKQINVQTDINDYEVKIPSEYLSLIINNLITNAIKYSHQGSTVSISASNGRLTIADNGPGMKPDTLEHIYDRFYRDKSFKNQIAGTGLGMSIVKQICDFFGINIKIYSQEGQGTTVQMDFQ